MVKNHLSQQSDSENGKKHQIMKKREIQLLYEKIRQQSEQTQIVIKIKKSYQWDNIKVETTEHTTGQNHKTIARVNWITL